MHLMGFHITLKANRVLRQTLVRCCLTRGQMESMYGTLQGHTRLPPPMIRCGQRVAGIRV